MAKYIIASTRLNDDGTVHSVSHPIEVDSDTINIIKIFDKTYVKVKHGRWIRDAENFGKYYCSECGFSHIPIDIPKWNFCPNCGSDNREVGND